jgi:protocatechuate 3,4-dioxygenase beta subunit
MTRFLIGLFIAGVAFAQTASVTGKMTDPNGAPVPGVRVAVQAAESGVQIETVTNQDGYYSLSSVPPGTYNLTVSKAGFEQSKRTG